MNETASYQLASRKIRDEFPDRVIHEVKSYDLPRMPEAPLGVQGPQGPSAGAHQGELGVQGIPSDPENLPDLTHLPLESSPVLTKPPVGLRPKWIVAEERIHEILKAIGRYSNAGVQIPIEWVEEYNELCEYINNRNK